jgi:hypothetical protein
MSAISFGVLAFRSFVVWIWLLHPLLFNVRYKTVWRLAYFVYQVLAVSQYNEWDPNPRTALSMCTWRRQARLRCKWEVWKNTVMLLRLAGTSILFFVCHKRYPFQEKVLLLIVKEIIYFVLFNSDIFSRSSVHKSTRPLGNIPSTAPHREHITYTEDKNLPYNCCIHNSTNVNIILTSTIL